MQMHLPRAQRYFCRFTITSLPPWSLLPSWLGRARSPSTLSRVSVIVSSSYVTTCHFSHPSFQTGFERAHLRATLRSLDGWSKRKEREMSSKLSHAQSSFASPRRSPCRMLGTCRDGCGPPPRRCPHPRVSVAPSPWWRRRLRLCEHDDFGEAERPCGSGQHDGHVRA